CTVTIPKGDEDLHSIISRWSDLGVKLPFAVVVPSTEEDIIAVINFASQNSLHVVPGGGGHGVFVPIGEKTIYLDMKNFNSVAVNKEESSVTIGGGAVTGEIIKACVAEGCYTLTGNSDALGVAGYFLGGGNSFITGLHGLAVDHVLSIRVASASGSVITLTPSSTGAEASLFSTLRGAGHGLTAILSLTLRTFPIAALSLPDSKIWNRKLILPGTAIAQAATLFTSLLPPPGPLLPVLIFGRAPPGTPAAGAPMLIISANYYGPSASAEAAAAPLLTPEASATAILATTTLVDFTAMNASSAAMSAHGGFKETYNAMLATISPASITSAFAQFVAFGAANPSAAARTYAVFGAWSTGAQLANAAIPNNKTYFAHRDRGVFFQFTPWYTDPATRGAADAAARGVVRTVRESDDASGLERVIFANNMIFGQEMGEVYTREGLEEVTAVKREWDPKGVFWSP
ncbi:FAD-binding domain-containing protein, partial [Mytilinidion resinicola]